MMRNRFPRRAPPAWLWALIGLLLLGGLPALNARWVQTLGISGEVQLAAFTSTPTEQKGNGAVLEVALSAQGDYEPQRFTLTPGPTPTCSAGAGGCLGQGLYSLRGEICLKNSGPSATQHLQIENILTYRDALGQEQPLFNDPIQVPVDHEIPAGETKCFSFETWFDGNDGLVYRLVSSITITNWTGGLPGSNRCSGPSPCPAKVTVSAEFNLPVLPPPTLTPEPTLSIPSLTVTLSPTISPSPAWTEQPSDTPFDPTSTPSATVEIPSPTLELPTSTGTPMPVPTLTVPQATPSETPGEPPTATATRQTPAGPHPDRTVAPACF